MSDAMAKLSDLRISARKARLVADLIRGKKVGDARTILQFTVKRTAHPLFKLLNSAAANAEHVARLKGERVDADSWVVSQITVNEGRTLYRYQSQARGRAGRIRKRSSHIELHLTAKKK
ncbi:MAG: ribosomal protein [Candidatus Hydrogenedentota bacterium]|jgi:large subunit ribosomal protein L22